MKFIHYLTVIIIIILSEVWRSKLNLERLKGIRKKYHRHTLLLLKPAEVEGNKLEKFRGCWKIYWRTAEMNCNDKVRELKNWSLPVNERARRARLCSTTSFSYRVSRVGKIRTFFIGIDETV